MKSQTPVFALSHEDFKQLIKEALGDIAPAANMAETEELFSLADVMDLFKKSRSTIFAWKREGILKPFYVSGSLYFKKSDISKMLNSKTK